MISTFILLAIGFLLLIKGADLFVDGASSIARKFNIPAMIIGLTIVAMGTSAPEASVSIIASITGQNDISVANVVGSNLFNILMILGVSSFIMPLMIDKNTIKRDTPYLIISTAMLLLFSLDLVITRIESLMFLIAFTGFIIMTIRSTKENNCTCEIKEISLIRTIIYIILGLTGIILGGNLVVNSASTIASTFGMSDNLIGLTIVAAGTSLPEFVTSLIAAKKGENDIAVGNVIGSNIFNILFVLGTASMISPITVSVFSVMDVVYTLLVTTMVYGFMRRNKSITKTNGIMFAVMYMSYIVYTIIR